MKHHLLAVAAIALFGTGAFAQDVSSSTVQGTVASSSVVVNSGTSTHNAIAGSTNSGSANGAAACAPTICIGGATAQTQGATGVLVTGTGPGFAAGTARQAGDASSLQGATIAPNALGTTGNANVFANGQTDTLSAAIQVGTSTSTANTTGNAQTNSGVIVNAPASGTSNGVGMVTGTNNVTSGGSGTFTNAGLLGAPFPVGSGAGNLGAFSGTITRP